MENAPALSAPSEGADIVADYASLGLTLGRHPLALLRKRLSGLGLLDAQTMNQRPHGAVARMAGLVTCRQRPDTASGVVFVTLEDETGNVNVVVWNRLVERQRRELLGARLLGVRGSLSDGSVQSVTEAAAKWGIPHLGRLSGDYRAAFGETPSE